MAGRRIRATVAVALASVVGTSVVVEAGAEGNSAVDQHIVQPLPGWVRNSVSASSLAQTSQVESQAAHLMGDTAVVAIRSYQGSPTQRIAVILVQFNGPTKVSGKAAQIAIATAAGGFCAAIVGHTVASTALQSIPTAQIASCGPAATSPRGISFVRGNILGADFSNGINKNALIQAAAKQYRALPLGPVNA